MDSQIFEKLSPTKLFFRCAIPSMVTMAFGALYQIADGLFVGRFIGEDALAAVNLITPIITMVFALSNMLATRASVRISVLLGEKKAGEASQIFSFTIKVIFLLSCIVGVIGLVFAEGFVRLLSPGATEQAIDYGPIHGSMPSSRPCCPSILLPITSCGCAEEKSSVCGWGSPPRVSISFWM